VQRLGALRTALGRIPPAMQVLLGFLALFAVAFSATIVPLLTAGGKVRGEVAGSVPSTAVAGQQMFFDLAIDNTSGSLIRPVCIAASFDLPVTVQQVVFQGLDRVPFANGRACGGDLTGQETASLRMVLVPHQTGTLHVTLVAAQGSQDIGPVLRRTIEVSAR
jgi:hypothetical protein